jgi:pectinesterase
MLRRFISTRKWILSLLCLAIVLLLVGLSYTGVSNSAAAPSSTSQIIVARDGSGNYKTVQAAVNAVPTNNQKPVVIYIKNGTYKEVVTVPANKPHITFYGQDAEKTIITYNNYHGKRKPDGTTFGTGDSASVLIEANNFNALNMTFQNSAGKVGQAVAIRVKGDRTVFRNCRFLGWQDTLYADNLGRQYYVDSYIEGAVDFIFGNATAVFDKSTIRSTGKGYITAHSRTSADQTSGYVIMNSRLTTSSTSSNPTYLGRPWRPYARVVYLNTRMDAHILPEGWKNWNDTTNYKTAYYAEYQSSGPGANASARVSWSHQLTSQQAKQFSIKNFLNKDGWLTSATQYLDSLLARGFMA